MASFMSGPPPDARTRIVSTAALGSVIVVDTEALPRNATAYPPEALGSATTLVEPDLVIAAAWTTVVPAAGSDVVVAAGAPRGFAPDDGAIPRRATPNRRAVAASAGVAGMPPFSALSKEVSTLVVAAGIGTVAMGGDTTRASATAG
jgi:hypothetical protein